jgi:hypothetical protein
MSLLIVKCRPIRAGNDQVGIDCGEIVAKAGGGLDTAFEAGRKTGTHAGFALRCAREV